VRKRNREISPLGPFCFVCISHLAPAGPVSTGLGHQERPGGLIISQAMGFALIWTFALGPKAV